MIEFWRVLRVIAVRRWFILASVVLAAGLVFVGITLKGQQKQWEAEALLEPQALPLVDVLGGGASGGQASPVANAASETVERTNRISDIVSLLRSSHDLYLKAAELLRKDEKARAKEVEEIFDRNGYFASTDTFLSTQADALVKAKQILPTQKQEWLKTNREKVRDQVINGLTKASDTQGSFAPGGVTDSPQEIAARIGENMTFDTVSGPLSTDNNPQITNQIRVNGKFEREAEAKLYVNLLCVAFIDYYTNRDATSANAKIALLNTKKQELEETLRARRKQLADFQRLRGYAATAQQETLSSQLTKTQDQYDQVVQDLSDAQGQIVSLQASLVTARPTIDTRIGAEQNPEVIRARTQVNQAQLLVRQLIARNLGDSNPEMLVAKAQLQEAQRQLASAISSPYTVSQTNSAPANAENLLQQARARRDGLMSRQMALSQQLATLKEQVRTLPDARNELAELNRTIAIADDSVRDVEQSLSRYQLIAINNGRAGTISIVSQASVKPVGGDITSKRGMLVVIVALLAGLICTAGVVLFDLLDPSVRTSQDAEKLFGLPVEGIIPEQTPDPMLAAWVTYRSPDSPVAEAYRLLRTRLLFTAMEHPFQSLVLATGRPGQGSTTTASNLAITLAQDGKRVVLVDANLRDPQLHNLFHSSNEVGLTTLLTVNLRLDDVVRPTAVMNMELLPAGPMPLNPSELLGSPRMRYLHHELKKRADFIVFDTPSAVAFSDAAILSSFIDATLLVVRANNVPRESEKQVRKLFEKARANIVGIVFNAVPADQVDAVHYHAHYYASSRRPDDEIGAAPDGYDYRTNAPTDHFGDIEANHDALDLAVVNDGTEEVETVRPVSPFDPAPDTAQSIVPTTANPPRDVLDRIVRPGLSYGERSINGNGANGNGYHPEGRGPERPSSDPTNRASTEAGGVAVLEKVASEPELDDESGTDIYKIADNWQEDEGEDLLEEARREAQSSGLIDVPWEDASVSEAARFRGIDLPGGTDTTARFSGVTERLLLAEPMSVEEQKTCKKESPEASVEGENEQEVESVQEETVLSLSIAPNAYVEELSADPEASESDFADDEPAPPVDLSSFSSAVNHNPLYKEAGKSGLATVPFVPTSEVILDGNSGQRRCAGRSTWILIAVMFGLAILAASIVLAIGQQVNVH